MITKTEVADYINANIDNDLTSDEINTLRSKISPALATVLIKLLGDVNILTEIRDSE
jgi:hypothetical protein